MNFERYTNDPYHGEYESDEDHEAAMLKSENTGHNPETLAYQLEHIESENSERALDSLRAVLSDAEKLKRANELWEQRYTEDPASFWEQESMVFLKTISAGERIQLLKRAARFLYASPDDAFLYAQNFPEDVVAFALYLDEEGGPTTSFEFKLAGLLASKLEQTYSFVKNSRWIRQLKEVEERRGRAKEHLLFPDSFYIGDTMSLEFDTLREEYFKVLKSACEADVYGNKRLDTQQMFGPQFDQLDSEQKLFFLESSLAQLHNILLEIEVFSSHFTKESHMRNKISRGHNPAHSMLFKTRQPSHVYEMAQENFEYDMNHTVSWGGAVEEYPFHRMLLTTITKVSEVASQMNDLEKEEYLHEINSITETCVDFWNKNRNPIFANAIAESLTKLDATYASQLLLEKITHEKEDKTALAAILYRLEFGQIGISKEGVKYLERMYDLGEFNNPDYFVNRLTPRGQIGIFNEENELVRYFYLEKFDDDNRDAVIQPAVLEFTYETLFVAKENETEEEREQRLQFLEEFKKSYFGFYDEKFLERTGVRFNNLTFKEQGSLLLFTKASNEVSQQKVFDFAKQHGEKGIRLFLLINQKDHMLGQKIIGLADSLDDQTMEAVTGALSGILARLEDISEFTGQDPMLQKATQTKLPEIQRKIIAKALTTLEQVIATTSQDDANSISDRILKKLENINADAVLLASTLTTLRHMDISDLEQPIDILNNFSETGLFDYEGYEFSSQELQQIKEMYTKNYAHTPELLDSLYNGFLESLKKENVDYKVIKHKDRIVALFAFEYLKDGSVYAGKFNIQQSYQGAELGSEMMENTLDQYALSHIIRADCNIEAAVSANYIERGFVAVQGYDFHETTSLHIVRNESMRDFLVSKEWTPYFITQQVQGGVGDDVTLMDGTCIMRSCEISDLKNVSLDLLEKVENDGSRYVLSRFIREKSDATTSKPKAFLVFEKVGKEVYQSYQSTFKRNVIDTPWAIVV